MQELIVYRNPAEAAFWHALQGAELIPIMAGVVVFFAVFIGLHHLVGGGRLRSPAWKTYAPMLVAALAGIATAYKLLL